MLSNRVGKLTEEIFEVSQSLCALSELISDNMAESAMPLSIKGREGLAVIIAMLASKLDKLPEQLEELEQEAKEGRHE